MITMSRLKKIRLFFITATLLTPLSATADWRTDIGWDTLQLYTGANLPTGNGITLEMTEAGSNYMPNTAHSAFSGITFTNISNTSSTTSNHATTVGLNYYGSSTSLLTGASIVRVRSADNFINDFLGTSGAVGSSSAAVMSHAYVGSANSSQEVALNKIITRFDYFCKNSGVINVVGMNNGNSTIIPPLFGSSYNSISVGRTDGQHSHEFTPGNYPGPGRQKPEIVSVASVNLTSYATGAVSSAASLLYAKATLSGNADASHPDTIKACLMAGATKEEFPNWSQAEDQPLDTTYGAGELNIFHSYRIVENTESSPGAVNFRGWSRDSAAATYSFTTPDYISPMTISAALTWQRSVSKSGGGQNTSYLYEALANLDLKLLNQSGATLQMSNSILDNIEHIWNTQLEPNTQYSLEVTNSANADFSLAWRVNGMTSADITAVAAGNNIDVSLGSLIVNVPYIIQRSIDLSSWSDVHNFTATSSTSSWTDISVPTGERVFYRLFFFEP